MLQNYEPSSYTTLNEVEWYGYGFGKGSGLREFIDFHEEVDLYTMAISIYQWTPEYEDLNARFTARTGEEINPYDLIRYDCCWAYAHSVINAGTDDTEDVREALVELIDGYQGVSGMSTFDVYGDRDGADYDIWVYNVIDGECYQDVEYFYNWEERVYE
jgi:ABC-type branched-subunit amino acid transport system substrate-binding protein